MRVLHARPLQRCCASRDKQLDPVHGQSVLLETTGHGACSLRNSDCSLAITTDKQLVRRISYTTPLKKNSLGPSTADCVEEWRLQSWTADAFVVCVEARTPKVRVVRLHTVVPNAC